MHLELLHVCSRSHHRVLPGAGPPAPSGRSLARAFSRFPSLPPLGGRSGAVGGLKAFWVLPLLKLRGLGSVFAAACPFWFSWWASEHPLCRLFHPGTEGTARESRFHQTSYSMGWQCQKSAKQPITPSLPQFRARLVGSDVAFVAPSHNSGPLVTSNPGARNLRDLGGNDLTEANRLYARIG